MSEAKIKEVGYETRVGHFSFANGKAIAFGEDHDRQNDPTGSSQLLGAHGRRGSY